MAKAKNKTKSKAKKTVSRVAMPELEESCDFSDCYESCDSSMDLDINKLVEADNFQSSLALELTQLIIENASSENKTAEHIINTFVLASKVVRENSALNAILEK